MSDGEDLPIEMLENRPRKKPGRPPKAQSKIAQLEAQIAQLTELISRGGSAGVGGLTREDFLEAVRMQNEMIRTNKEADIAVAAEVNAKAMAKAMHPENAIAPGISIYNPKGEHQHPRPRPSHIYMLAGYPICDPGNWDTTTWSEIELLNQLQAGEYPITKSDGTDVKVLVKREEDAAGRPYRTTLFANGRGLAKDDPDQKQNWPPLLQILTQMVTGERPEQSFVRYQSIIEQQARRIAELERAAGASN